MATSNYCKQKYFELYANNFEIYEEETNTTYFNYLLLEDCKNELNTINRNLQFFELSLADGYYGGVQIIIENKTTDFDTLDFLDYEQYYDKQSLYNDFGYNSYILKRKIFAEINKINNKIFPELANNFDFEHLCIIGRFSNGETVYSRA